MKLKNVVKSLLKPLRNIRGVVLTGPMFSLSARGSLAKTLTYSIWKGIAYGKEWFIPQNPQSATQTNVRTAMALLVAEWQAHNAATKALWETYAESTGMSGFNQMIRRGMDQYVIQITTAVLPVSVSLDTVAPPGETFTWA